MPWSLLVGAIPYLIAAAIGARVAWGVQGVRVDSLKADVALAESATKRVEGERDNWRDVAAEQSVGVHKWQTAATKAQRAAAAAVEENNRRQIALADEIAALEASLAARGVIPLTDALRASREATDALP